MSDNPGPDQLKIITATRGTNFPLGKIQFHLLKEGKIPIKKRRYPVLRTNTKPQQLIKDTKILFS